jgi:hypothetical protein
MKMLSPQPKINLYKAKNQNVIATTQNKYRRFKMFLVKIQNVIATTQNKSIKSQKSKCYRHNTK